MPPGFREGENVLRTSDPSLYFRMTANPSGYYETAVTGKGNRFSPGKRILLALASLILLAPMGPSMAESGETLGPGDGIRVTVFDNPELTTEARISSQGMISFPLLGDVKLGGLTPGAAVRQAQLTLLKSVRWSKPQYWAAFVLEGE